MRCPTLIGQATSPEMYFGGYGGEYPDRTMKSPLAVFHRPGSLFSIAKCVWAERYFTQGLCQPFAVWQGNMATNSVAAATHQVSRTVAGTNICSTGQNVSSKISGKIVNDFLYCIRSPPLAGAFKIVDLSPPLPGKAIFVAPPQPDESTGKLQTSNDKKGTHHA